MHNLWANETNKKTPFHLLIGGVPSAHEVATQDAQSTNDQIATITKAREQVKEAMTKVQ